MTGVHAHAVAQARERIAVACRRVGRNPDGVRIVAASKGQPAEAVTAVAASGLTVFGESRVQEAAKKVPHCPGGLEWHLIGHLQRNKVETAANLFDCVHSVDSERLVVALAVAASASTRGPLRVLIQVNLSSKADRLGVRPEAVPQLLELAAAQSSLSVMGLMTVPEVTVDPEGARPVYVGLARLRDELQVRSGLPLPELSMGMSGDLEIAVEAGATLVRLGSSLFGPRR